MRIKQTLYFLIATLALLFFTFAAQGEEKPFITKWKGEAGKELKIPIFGTGYKLVIKKASDNSELKTEASLTITENENFYTYTPTEDGELLVEAGPDGVEYIRFVSNESKRGSAENLLTVEQFGTVVWKSMENAFSFCSNMQFSPTVDTPDLSNVTNMGGMFNDCSAFNQDLSGWNVSNVTDMGLMFYYCSAFNQDLSSWNVSNVTDMDAMFQNCSAFNQNLGSWTLKKCKELGLSYCGMSIENYFKSLEGWAAQTDINEKLELSAYGLYFNETGKSARTKLIKEKHWVILGDVSEGGRVYNLHVGGVQLSTDNINSFQEALTEVGVLKKGKVSVTLEGEKPVLLLENAELTAPYDGFPIYMLESWNNKITIQLRGVCTITQLSYRSAIFVSDGTIVGRNINDKLLVKGNDVDCRTAIRNCTVETENALTGAYGGALEIDNAVVKAKRITRVGSLTLKNCSILQPDGAHYDAAKREVVDKDGNTAENVVIGSTGGGTTVVVTGVKLSYNNLPLKTGDSFTLLATVEPANATNKAVTWSSDNDAVATVSDAGVVEAKAVGTANITVTTKDGGHTATCSVEVKNNGTNPVHVTGVKLSPATLPLKLGTSHTLVASVEPANATNKAVTWSSDNDAVATVSDAGLVEAKTVGTANITVTTKDGGYTATCSFTVTAEDVVLTGLTISPSEASVEVDKETTLSLTFVPITATHKGVKWSSSEPTIATVDEHGKVKGIAAGTTTITAVSEKYETVKNTCKVTVTRPAAVEDAIFTSVVVAPNPFNAQLCISNGDVRGKYALYNTQGVEVAFGVLEGAETRINTASLPAGMYLLRLTAENGAMNTFTVVKR